MYLKNIATIRTEKVKFSEIFNYISTENMLPNKGGITTPDTVPNSGNVSVYKAGDVLLSNIRPYFKKIWFATQNGTASNDVIILYPLKEVDNRYLYYVLADDNFFSYVMTGAKGTKMPRGDKQQIMQYPVLCPPLDEQKRIAEILGAFDDKIELLQKQNKTLEDMAKTIFKSWFVNFDVVKAKQRGDSKADIMQEYHLTEELYALFPSSFEDSSLGPIPSGWTSTELKYYCQICSGFAFKSSNFNKNGKYKLVTIRNVQDGFFVQAVKDNITDIPSKMPDYCYLQDGDILLSLTGNVGRICLVYGKNYLLNQRVAKLLPRNSGDYMFLYSLFRTPSVYKKMQELAVGSAQQNLSPILTGNILFPLINRRILDIFSEITLPMYRKILINNKQIQTLTELRDTLLPRLISGKIRV